MSFVLFKGGGRVEVDGLKFDNVDFCGVGVFVLRAAIVTPGEEPPIKVLISLHCKQRTGYLTYNAGPFGYFGYRHPEHKQLRGQKFFKGTKVTNSDTQPKSVVFTLPIFSCRRLSRSIRSGLGWLKSSIVLMSCVFRVCRYLMVEG